MPYNRHFQQDPRRRFDRTGRQLSHYRGKRPDLNLGVRKTQWNPNGELHLKKAVVVGHSFVKSTLGWCRSRRLPHTTARDLREGKVSQGVVNAGLLEMGNPFRSVELLHTPLFMSPEMDSLLVRAAEMSPDIVLLNTGSNDLCKIMRGQVKVGGPKTPRDLADKVLAAAVKLRKEHHVPIVMIMSVIRREDVKPVDTFVWMMDKFNMRLATMCDYTAGVYYYHVTGYCRTDDDQKREVAEYTRDNIHPFMDKYRGKMKGALCEGLTRLLARQGKPRMGRGGRGRGGSRS